MMAPFVYEQARANAPFHVQLFRYNMAKASDDATAVRATCRILRIFRNEGGSLHFGQKIHFAIPIINRAGSPVLDGTIRLDWFHLFQARFWEAFLECWDGGFHLVHSQIAPIQCPSRHPICGPETTGFLCQGNFQSKIRSKVQ